MEEVVGSEVGSTVGELVAESHAVPTSSAAVDVSEIGAAERTKIDGSQFEATFGGEVVGRILEQQLE